MKTFCSGDGAMDKTELQEAESNLNDLIMEYSQYQGMSENYTE